MAKSQKNLMPRPNRMYLAPSRASAKIRKAHANWVESLDKGILLGNWGDIFDDEGLHEWRRRFTRRYSSQVSALVDELREALKEADGECREIIVVPPIDQASDDALATIAAALTEEFPRYAWRVTVESMPRGDAFVLIPLRLAPQGTLLRAPPAALLRDVGKFLVKIF